MVKNVFVNNNGTLNFRGEGRIAKLEDLQKALFEGDRALVDIVQVREGVYKFVSAEQQRKVLETEKAKDIKQWNFKGEYIEILDKKPSLYLDFESELDEDIETVISCAFGDNALKAVTRKMNLNELYIYDYYKNDDNTIDKKCININKYMLDTLF